MLIDEFANSLTNIKHTAMNARYLSFGFILFIFLLSAGSEVYAAPTTFQGTIAEDTVWTASSSPYVLTGKVTVAEGATFTLEKGTVIKLMEQGIVVNGVLIAAGTEAEPVYITSQKDDSVGGDSNGDGSNSVPASGNWQGIQFSAGALGTFDHVVIRYAGYQNTTSAPAISTIHNVGAEILVRNSELSFSKSCGIGQTSGASQLQNSWVHHMTCGVGVLGGTHTFADNTIEDSTFGLFSNGTSDLTFTDNTFVRTQRPADVTLSGLTSFEHEGNTASESILGGLLIRGLVSAPVELTKDSMPYIVSSNGGSTSAGGLRFITQNDLTVGAGVALTLEPGVVVKFHDSGKVLVQGTLDVQGTSEDPVYFISIKDDSIGGDTNGDGSATLPATGNWLHLRFDSGSVGNLSHVIVRHGGYDYPSFVTGDSLSNIFNNGGTLNITSSEIAYGKKYGLRNDSGSATISQSNIHDNSEYGVLNSSALQVDARNNYWGDPSGPYHLTQNPSGLGNRVSDNVLFTPWKGVYCTENCYSNVLFLPGIQGSRLFIPNSIGGEDRVWEPFGNQDVQQLEMTEAGESIQPLYTGEIVTKAFGKEDIYEKFSQSMDKLVDDEVINEWSAFAYDWRYSVEDVAENGTQYEIFIRDAVTSVENLAANSRSGKVTLIGHSNGGLLSKALMMRLEREGKSNLVDKVVLLASPQLGTPQAVGALLHGYEQEKFFGLLIDDEISRDVSRNMPGAYGLLPSQKYLDVALGLVVFFDGSESTAQFRNVYGNAINNEAELIEFIAGDVDGRADAQTVEEAIKANRAMLEEARELHEKLDSWVAPSGVEVVEVVGVGLNTISGFQYTEFEERVCAFFSCEIKTFYKPLPFISQYGDYTVMRPSAEGYEGEKDTYYIDLFKIKQSGKNIDHGTITEHDSTQHLVKSLLVGQAVTSEFVSQSLPEVNEKRILLGAHSPVSLEARDGEGRVTKIELTEAGTPTLQEGIPGSDYFELAASKYLILPAGTDYEFDVKGTGDGGLVLTVDSLDGEVQTPLHTINVATITPQTLIDVSYEDGRFSNIFVDVNGDGTIDQEITPEGEIINEVTYADLLESINSLPLKKNLKQPLLTLALFAEELNKRSAQSSKYLTLERITLEQLEYALKLYVKMRVLQQSQIEPILIIIKKLKVDHGQI